MPIGWASWRRSVIQVTGRPEFEDGDSRPGARNVISSKCTSFLQRNCDPWKYYYKSGYASRTYSYPNSIYFHPGQVSARLSKLVATHFLRLNETRASVNRPNSFFDFFRRALIHGPQKIKIVHISRHCLNFLISAVPSSREIDKLHKRFKKSTKSSRCVFVCRFSVSIKS